MTFKPYLLAGLAPAALAACMMEPANGAGTAAALVEAPASSAAPLVFNSEFTCSGQSAEIGVLNDQTVLRAEGRDYVLEPVETASGAKYVWAGEPETSFWSKGEGGVLTLAGTAYPDCVRTGGYGEYKAPAETRPAERPPGLWRARGNEPGWLLTMDGETMTLSYDYGAGSVEAPEPAAVSIKDGMQWTAAEAELTVTALTRLCEDNMTGMPYPAQVSVQLGERTFKGCGGEPASLLAGDEWTVKDLNGEAPGEDVQITLSFDTNAGRLSGKGGCNRYNAAYTLTGESLSFGPAMSTQMACAEPAMAQERAFLDLLGEVNRFSIDESGALRLISDAEGTIMARR